jgi:HK97 family phage prohead protease
MPWHVAKSAGCPSSRPWAVIKDADGSVAGCHPTEASANDQLAALYASEAAAGAAAVANASRPPIGEPMQRNGVEHRAAPLEDVEVSDSRQGEGQWTMRGHAAVFNRWSLDLGGFREKIAKGAFGPVLDRSPDVHAVWDHDTARVLARTRGGSLELREDPVGLHMWARVADTSYSRDLRVLMESGLVDQASFAFTVARDEWRFLPQGDGEEERVERTVHEIGELFDVTVTAQAAYPTTNAEVVRSLRSRLEAQVELGVVPERMLDRIVTGAEPSIAPFVISTTSTSASTTTNTTADGTVPHLPVATEEGPVPAEESPADEARRQRALTDLRNLAAGETALAKERRAEIQRRRYRLRRDDR